MDNVFLVVYEENEYQECPRFEVLEVFKTRGAAECYIGNMPDNDEYTIYNLHILEKKLWE